MQLLLMEVGGTLHQVGVMFDLCCTMMMMT
jgi:hypothetical protein